LSSTRSQNPPKGSHVVETEPCAPSYLLVPSKGDSEGGYILIQGHFSVDTSVLFGPYTLSPTISSDTTLVVLCPPGVPGSKVDVYP
jgi:hypothetical protein